MDAVDLPRRALDDRTERANRFGAAKIGTAKKVQQKAIGEARGAVAANQYADRQSVESGPRVERNLALRRLRGAGGRAFPRPFGFQPSRQIGKLRAAA